MQKKRTFLLQTHSGNTKKTTELDLKHKIIVENNIKSDEKRTKNKKWLFIVVFKFNYYYY
jgi:hypothetical protein